MCKRPQSAQPWEHARSAGGPKVGIFWLVGKRLVLASTPLAKAGPWGEFRNFPASHIDRWAGLQRDGSVPRDVEYEEPPRGRVAYNTRTRLFTLFADRCIITSKRLVSKIIGKLNLPEDTQVLRDDYVPTGFKPYGSKTYAVSGHPFGLDLSAEDRKALIAFLKTL